VNFNQGYKDSKTRTGHSYKVQEWSDNQSLLGGAFLPDEYSRIHVNRLQETACEGLIVKLGILKRSIYRRLSEYQCRTAEMTHRVTKSCASSQSGRISRMTRARIVDLTPTLPANRALTTRSVQNRNAGTDLRVSASVETLTSRQCRLGLASVLNGVTAQQ
jgi:hypothetical protein